MAMTSQDLRDLLEDYPFLLIPQEAEDLLKQIASSIDLLQLYEHYFPDDFREAQEQGDSFIPEPECAYSECEEQFFGLVDSHLFPLFLDWILDDIYDARTFAYHIPIAPFGLDFEGGYGDTPLGWLLLLYLLDILDEDLLRTYGACEDDRLFAISLPREGEVSQSLLKQRCEAQTGPIVNLPYALQMLYYDTDTVWLDTTMSNLEISNLCWGKEDIDRLHRQYLLAQDIQEKAECFCAWLEEEPFQRFSMVARLWMTCIRDTPPLDPQPKAITVSATQFVDGINFGELFGRHIALPAHRERGDDEWNP
ncbi:MAG: hypothetical protein H0U76_22460 [Ktedonobacteraceae bacterium]|nr:hypothetical protein [Ktedonobacteraceae bacterium]